MLDIRSLESLGAQPEHYGALLIPILIEKLPAEIRLVINRKLGEIGYSLPKLLDFLKEKIFFVRSVGKELTAFYLSSRMSKYNYHRQWI